MTKRKRQLSLSQALDALSYLAEIEDIEGDFRLPLPELKEPAAISFNIEELGEKEGVIEEKMKEIFKVILGHLKKIYESDDKKGPAKVRQVKSIMVMVGEATKNLEKLSSLFELTKKTSVTDLAEYKRLQEFYTRRVEKQVDEGLLSRWIMGLSGGKTATLKRKARERKREKSAHVFVDLDMVKSDSEYELLLMRKEDGTRFYSPRLIRNIKLVCDFGGYQGNGKDIFSIVHDWRDVICHVASIHLLRSLNLSMKRFYQDAYKYKGRDVVGSLNKGFMALMMSANPGNLRVNLTKGEADRKTCQEYFADFQTYLRDALNTREYQRYVAYPPKQSQVLASCILEVAQRICRAVYLHLHIMQELFLQVHKFLGQARNHSLKTTEHTDDMKGIFSWSKLAYDYAEIVKMLKLHASGPLQRILESLEESKYTAFDSLLQFNFPHAWFELYVDDMKITNLRMASPTRQTLIHKAVVDDEFKGFLQSVGRDGMPTHHLLINLQDRTSWRESSRCQALEQLQKSSTFNECLTAVTLATDTPFYHQSEKYETMEDAKEFIAEFKKELRGSSTGFYLPEKIKKQILPDFVNETLKGIHEFFFEGAQLISHKDRKNFISLFYILLTLKLIDIVNPTSFSYSCKDAIDIGGAASLLLFVFMKLLREQELTNFETEFIEAMIYGPSILIRERAMLPEVLNRGLRTLQTLERVKDKIGHTEFIEGIESTFAHLYHSRIFDAMVELPVFEIREEAREAA